MTYVMKFLFAALVADAATTAPEPRIAAVAILVNDRAAERRFYMEALDFKLLRSEPVAGGRIVHLASGLPSAPACGVENAAA